MCNFCLLGMGTICAACKGRIHVGAILRLILRVDPAYVVIVRDTSRKLQMDCGQAAVLCGDHRESDGSTFFCSALTLFALIHQSRGGSLGGVAYSLTMVIFGTAFAVCALLSFAPETVVKAKAEGLELAKAFPDSYRQASEILNRISRLMWKESPWSGVGVGAFNLHAKFLAEKADWYVLAPNVSSALTSYWTILAERGILGSLTLVSAAVLFLFAWVKSLVQAVIYLHTRDDADVFMFACAPIAWVLPAVLALFCVDALFTPVLSCSVTLFAFAAILALSAASFPRAPRSRAATTD